MIFYFSGCGNSRFIAKSISEALKERLVFIPEAERNSDYEYSLAEDGRVGFVFPIYSWCPPQLVADFVKKLHFDRQPSYVWMAVTCGDNGGYADRVFAGQLQEAGLPMHSCFCFVMPNTYINMSFMGIDKAEISQRKIEKAKVHLPEVIREIKERKPVMELKRGMFPKFKTDVIGKSFHKWVSDEPFFSTGSCISCGKCVKVCPLQNISLADGRPKWNGHCTNCDACYHYCPQNAIQFGKASKGKGQYHFPE